MIEKCNLHSNAKRFPMPISLQYIKELGEKGIDWKGLHVIDVFSLVYSIRIDNCKKILSDKATARMSAAGVQAIMPASESDFESL